jgi:hypothetical protein
MHGNNKGFLMTTPYSTAASDQPSRWNSMSDFTRIGVGLALGLGVMTFVVLCSMAGPVIRTIFARLLYRASLPSLTYESVTTGYLACLYVAVVVVGLSHAHRTTRAFAARSPKASGKPAVGAGPFVTWLAVMGMSTVVGVLCGLFRLAPHEESVGTMAFATFVGGVVPWILLGLLCLVSYADRRTDPNCTGMVQMMGILPALLLTVMGFSAVNLGLLFGLWTLMAVLVPLESNELPAAYPDTFDPPAAAG